MGSTRHGEATIRSRGSPYRRAPLEYLDIAIRSRRKHRHIQRMPENRRVSVVREAERSIAHRHQHHHQLEGIVSFLSQLSDPTTNSLTMSNSCKRDLEVDRYEHFVAAANESLKMLKPLVVQGRGANIELDILFHRNDPKEIYGSGNNGPLTERKPDLVVTSMHSARRAAGPPLASAKWQQIASEVALEQPQYRFQWYDVLCAVELQHIAKIDEGDVDALCQQRSVIMTAIPVPPHPVKTGPNPKKRNMSSESMPSAAEHPAKRAKFEICCMPRSQLTRSRNIQQHCTKH